MKILGIDEAGRGCVIGPMAISAVLIKSKGIEEFRKLGVKDSKKLTPKRRRKLAKGIKRLAVDFRIMLHQPKDIDLTSLNELDLQSIVKLIDEFQPDKAIFDVPTHPGGVKRFVQSVNLRIKQKNELIGENKADEKYLVVSAASILAKVERENVIKKLREEFGDFGSGYMSDQKTQRFLKDCYQEKQSFPQIVRHKWSSVQKFLVEQQRFINI